jgi:hypothetical protein
MRATCPAHLILLDVIILTILGEEYSTYIINAVYEWVVAAVTHREPITTEPDYVNISVPATRQNYNYAYFN